MTQERTESKDNCRFEDKTFKEIAIVVKHHLLKIRMLWWL